MFQPNKNKSRRHDYDARRRDLKKVLNAFRAADRTVVETSMHLYEIPRRDRPALLKQHRHLHETIRERLLGFSHRRGAPGRSPQRLSADRIAKRSQRQAKS